MRLIVKFCLAMILILAATLGGTAWMLIHYQQERLLSAATLRAETVLSLQEACKEYVSSTLRPAVEQYTEPTRSMIPEAESSSFMARGVFESFRKRMPEYQYREASLQPLNPKNRATPEEAELIRRFASDSLTRELKGVYDSSGREQYRRLRSASSRDSVMEQPAISSEVT